MAVYHTVRDVAYGQTHEQQAGFAILSIFFE